MADIYKTPWLHGKVNSIISIWNGAQYISLPDPSSMSIDTYDLDSDNGSGRNQAGTMFRDRVAIKEKLNCEFPPMYAYDYSLMLELCQNTSFTVRYYSYKYKGWRETEMYVGDRSAEAYNMYRTDTPETNIVDGFSMNFIEM